MLSVSSIGSAGGASEYYGKDDYYVSGEADAPGVEWKGKGSEQAGLKGTATTAQFREVLQGKHAALQDPDRVAKPDEKHRAGWDLTFSAPKSVSLAYLVGGDTRLVAAHRAAVDKAMAYAEKHFAITRVRDQGKIREVQTGNLVYASTEHTTSRKGDPQLHTHNIVANATYDASSGKFRALETLSLFKHRQLVGRIYQAELAKSALTLGYDVNKDSAKGTFELAAYSREKILAFSKRHSDIEQAASLAKAKNGGELTGAQRDALALRDRPKKLDVPRADLQKRWASEAKQVGLDNQAIVAKAQGRDGMGADVTPTRSGLSANLLVRFTQYLSSIGAKSPPSFAADPYGGTRASQARDMEAREAASFGIRVMEQGKAVFSQHEVLGRALEIAKAGMTADRVLGELAALGKDGRLLQADKTIREGLTTQSAVSLERGLVSAIEEGKGQATPMLTPTAAAAHLAALQAKGSDGIRLNEGQALSAALLLTSPDRYVGVQGFAGVGKTTMFRVVKEAAQEAGTELSGLAPTHAAAQAMKDGAGIPAQTIEKWLNGTEAALAEGGAAADRHKAAWAGRTMLVDESSMQSNAQAERLVKAAEAVGLARMIYIGDERQLGSPEAGAPWRLALGSGLEHARMTEIVRQRDPVLLAAVQSMAKGDISAAFRGLGERMVAVGSDAKDADLAQAALNAWRGYKDARGEMPAVIVPTNALRAEVAQRIRSELIAGGQLGEGRTVPTLLQVRMTTAEASRAVSYKEGQVLVFHSANRGAGIKRGSHLTVVGRDQERNTLVLDDGRGGTKILDLSAQRSKKGLSHDAYKPAELDVRTGDRLVWNKMDRDLGVRVGEGFTVEKIDKAGWTIRDAAGDTKTVQATDPILRFVSHGYAETADRSQGSTYKDVVAVLSSRHGEAATEARAYVQMSRASENLTFVTNDPRLLAMKLNKQDGLNAIASHELAGIVSDLAGKDALATLAKDGLDGSTPDKTPTNDKPEATVEPGTGKADEKAFEKAHEPAAPAQSHSL